MARGGHVRTNGIRLHYTEHPGDGPPHWSPFEHVCRPMAEDEQQWGNLSGWRQYRHDLEGALAIGGNA